MRYGPIDSNLFKANRERLKKGLKKNSMAVFNANDILPTNSDGTMRFKQNSDLFYMTGVDQEETILIISPDYPDENWREVLFVKKTSPEIITWEGHKLTKNLARELTGIDTVMWLSDFERVFNTMMVMGNVERVYLNTNEHYRAGSIIASRDTRFIHWCQERYPLHQYDRLAPLMHQLRCIKSKEEVRLLQRACDITAAAFTRVLKFVRPGVMEYEIEAEYIHEFIRRGSRGFAYEPIVASGASSCVLHYIDNDKECKNGDVLLLDVGAEYANYNADLTRTIPVSGRFSKRQREVYNAVLRVHREAVKMLQPGVEYYKFHAEVKKIMESELINLKLITKNEAMEQSAEKALVNKYFMHGTSHQLGLDVHDVGNMYQQLKPGMVWTVEPGIYIKEEKLGVRIENNILVTEKGPIDLMSEIPIEADEIEEIMNA